MYYLSKTFKRLGVRNLKDENENSFYIRSSIIILVTTFLALIGLHGLEFLLIVFPVLFIVNILQNGLSEGLTNMVVTVAIIAIIESINIGIFFAIGFIPFTVIISILIKKRERNLKIIGYSAMSIFLSALVIMVLAKVMGIDVVKTIENIFREPVDMQLEVLKNMGLSNYEFFTRKELLEDRYKYILLILPSTFLILSAIVSYINYMLSGIILDKLGIKLVNMPKLSRFSLPNNIIFGVILMVGVTFLSGSLGFSYYETVFVNISVIIMLGFFLQGLAVADYFLNKLKFKPIFKILIYASFILTQAFTSILTIVGLIDIIFDIRKIKRKKVL